jgi:hypothetical protein
MRFFTGLHQPSDAQHFDASFVSVNRLRNRKSSFKVGDWIMDSGAFTTIATHGGYPLPVEAYAADIRAICGRQMHGNLLAVVAQDYMCEAWMLAKTGLTVADHQRLTIERYDALVIALKKPSEGKRVDVPADNQKSKGADSRDGVAGSGSDFGCALPAPASTYIMPVLQGYAPEDYVSHIRQYGARLAQGAWVGVGSICKRNGDPAAIWRVLNAIKTERHDLRLHGFGLKQTALQSWLIRDMLYTADSMAWSFAARKLGRNPNDWREARLFTERIGRTEEQRQAEMSI